MPPANLTTEDIRALEIELCSRSLRDFMIRSWHVLEPGNLFVDGWAIGAICEHLQAVTDGEINRLLINVPPGMSKSLTTAVIWPAWEWGPRNKPWLRYMSGSHGLDLATRDCRLTRRLVTSDWYQERWPIKLTSDQNQKTFFENEASGWRRANAVKSMTGHRGHRVLLDDPNVPSDAFSALDRQTVIREFRETIPTRMIHPSSSALVVIQQRIHEEDVSGFILGADLGYTHLMLPMEFETERRCKTFIFEDPRTFEGELLFPERFPAEVVERDKRVMGGYAAAGQLQQRPAPRAGSMIPWECFEVAQEPPPVKRTVRYWDTAGKEGGGCYTAGVKMGVTEDNNYVILDVVRGQWAAPRREAIIRQTAELDGREVHIWIERQGGSSGLEAVQDSIRRLAGYVAKEDLPTGSKVARAAPFAVAVENGAVTLLDKPWLADYIEEARLFPGGKYLDQIDATAGAFAKLATAKRACFASGY